MTNFLIRRLGQAVLLMGFLSFAFYYLMTLMPGDPIDMMISANPKITSEDVERLRALYGLDQPVYVRYTNWMGDVLTGDLGYSRTYKVPVAQILGPRLVNTFVLSICAMGFSLLLSIPLGIFAALRSGKSPDYLINGFAFIGVSTPVFYTGIILIIIAAVWLKILPAGGTHSILPDDASSMDHFIDRAKYLILPVLSLATLQVGYYVRFIRSEMLQAMRNDYVRTAKAKGLSSYTVTFKHTFRNALLPFLTVVTLSFAGVFSGAIITETVFAYQGVGKLVLDSFLANDFSVAMVTVMLSTFMVIIMRVFADILYALVDPRIRL